MSDDPVEPKAPGKKAAAKPKAADPEQLAADIEKTREELAETLDAIAEKVSPKRVAKRTTKKVATAVKDTAHDAAEAVKDTASSAKDKVTGGTSAKAGTDWAPEPAVEPVTAPIGVAAQTEERREVTALPTPPREPVGLPSYPSPYEPAQPLIKKEYIAAGAAVGLLAWLLLRRRK